MRISLSLKWWRIIIGILGLAIFLLSNPSSQAAPPEQKPNPSQTTSPQETPTNNWAVQLKLGSDPNVIAKQYGFENAGEIGTLPNFFIFRRPAINPANAKPNLLRNAPEVLWLEQQIARQQNKRVIPSDSLYVDQWHLDNTGQSGGTPGEDINVVPVWDNNILGTGVVIGIVDDGLQHTHPDLAPNYIAAASFDFNDGDADPAPDPLNFDFHGTSVAGVAAARDNSNCGVGSAFRAGLSGLRLIAAPSTDADEASALTYEYDVNQIFSNSWGPFDDGIRLEGPGALTQMALVDGITNGRGGLGNIYVWAAGNGLANNDNVNYDGYANSRFTIAIGAVDHNGVQASYSEPGAAMLVTAPSSGSGVGVTTTDLVASDGYNTTPSPDGDCTDTFGGTSSATPLVSGVIALMLEANPNLTWRDIQHIFVETVVQNDPGDVDWTANGAGHHINHKYGFGRVDAEAAVNAALAWTNVAAEVSIDSSTLNVDQSIPDNDSNGITSNFVVDENITLEHVELIFDATHTYRGDLEVILTSPAGTQSVLAETHLIDSNDDYTSWKFMSVRNWGEESQGVWNVRVSDQADQDTGTFNSWQLILYGTPRQEPDSSVTVTTCTDQNADGDCGDPEDGVPPVGMEVCLDGDCQTVVDSSSPTLTFNLAAGNYTPIVNFTGNSTGHYPTTPRVPIDVVDGQEVEIDLGAVYPIHPKGIAIHEASNKAYAAFQGPAIISGTEVISRPYPFVAVIDGESDEVLYTIAGGDNPIGLEPWGVAASGNYVYVGAFAEGVISIIDTATDTVVKNIDKAALGRDDFQPTAPAVNPTGNGWVHFPDYRGGRVVILNGLDVVADNNVTLGPNGFSPFEMVVAHDNSLGHNYVTLRDALQPQQYKIGSLNSGNGQLEFPGINLPGGRTGNPHAIGLWQPLSHSGEGRFFFTYADDPRGTDVDFPNPNQLAVYSFPRGNPKDILQRNADIMVGDYAEVGLVYDETNGQMIGTYGGFAYKGWLGDEVACSPAERGGTYTVTNADGGLGAEFIPSTVVGNPPLAGPTLDWKNPFEVAVNATTGKVYITDRCWNDYEQGGMTGGSAVLIYQASTASDGQSSPDATEEANTLVGDVNGDGQIDVVDLAYIASRYGSNDPTADLNGDGVVDIIDMSLAALNYQ